MLLHLWFPLQLQKNSRRREDRPQTRPFSTCSVVSLSGWPKPAGERRPCKSEAKRLPQKREMAQMAVVSEIAALSTVKHNVMQVYLNAVDRLVFWMVMFSMDQWTGGASMHDVCREGWAGRSVTKGMATRGCSSPIPHDHQLSHCIMCSAWYYLELEHLTTQSKHCLYTQSFLYY